MNDKHFMFAFNQYVILNGYNSFEFTSGLPNFSLLSHILFLLLILWNFLDWNFLLFIAPKSTSICQHLTNMQRRSESHLKNSNVGAISILYASLFRLCFNAHIQPSTINQRQLFFLLLEKLPMKNCIRQDRKFCCS